MRTKALLAAAAVVALASPSYATLQIAVDVGGTSYFCADGTACDTNGTPGVLQLGNQVINGVVVNGSIQSSTKGPPTNILNTSTLSMINNAGANRDVTVTVSDTGFVGPVNQWATAGSGTWQTANGSTALLSWYNDPLNDQGADFAGDTPGGQIDKFGDTAVGLADAFSHNGSGATSDGAFFSMTENIVLALTAGAQLVNNGSTEIKPTAIVEPGSLGMLLVGLTGVAVARRRRWI